jgi:hypothetical protein
MADEPGTPKVTSEKKKDPRRVEAGKRLAVLSKAAREMKKKEVVPKESSSSDSMITYIGVAIALVSLVLAYKSHQRETKEPEPQHIPETVVVTRKTDESKLDSLE